MTLASSNDSSRDVESLWIPFTHMGQYETREDLSIVVEGKGCWVFDEKQNKTFDLMSGMWLKAIGYGRREMADAVYDAMQSITFNPWGSTSKHTMDLSSKVASLSPDKNSRVFLVSGGSEANETALKIAKRYHAVRGQPGRYKVLSRRGSYHGATHATMALGGGGVAIPWEYGPLQPGNIYVPNPLKYRCSYCAGANDCRLECAKDVERAILAEGPETIAAFIGEPISIAGGVAPPDPEYWPTIRKICDKYGILLIFDEVVTAFGRTGKWFASEHWQVEPDITTVAKALSSGYLPIGAAIVRKEIADAFLSSDNALHHLLTFGGHPICCAAALKNLQIMEDEQLIENSAHMGEYLYQQLQRLHRHPIVGDIRGGFGLLCGVEIVADKVTKQKFSKDVQMPQKLNAIMIKNQLLTRVSDIVPLVPPLVISRDEVNFVVDALDRSLSELQSS